MSTAVLCYNLSSKELNGTQSVKIDWVFYFKRVSYKGYYSSLPSWRWEFNSPYPLKNWSISSIGQSNSLITRRLEVQVPHRPPIKYGVACSKALARDLCKIFAVGSIPISSTKNKKKNMIVFLPVLMAVS